jgi:hypothetical protein
MSRIGRSWRMRLAVSSFVLIFFAAVTVPAEMKLIPMWDRLECGPSPRQEFACYDFTKAQSIVKIDLDFQLQLKEFEALKLKYGNLGIAYEKLDKSTTLLGQAIERLEQRNQEKHAVLQTTTMELKKAESRSVWNYLPWIVTATIILAGVGFGCGFYVGTR